MSVKHSFSLFLCVLLFMGCRLAGAVTDAAEQKLRFGAYTIYYTALTTAQLPREVAAAYGIVRSSNRALVHITVIQGESMPKQQGQAVRARVKGSAVNLNGQGRSMKFREIMEGKDSIYYIAETYVSHQEVLRFNIELSPLDGQQPLNFSFEQEFYTR